jgi:hypothetical protein|nr:MAG TPA: L SHAPED TAIL FIBER PROTEIN [Bacteriophage sp.]
MHVIKLNGYNATTENGKKLELGTFDSYGEEQLKIVKAPDWENLSVIATFNPPNKKPVQVVVDSVTGVIKVPKEATADLYGVGTIVFVGLADGVQRISADCEYIVRKHSNASGTEPAEPTPDLLQQVLTLSKDAQTAAKNAEQSAKNAAKDAADTVKPYKEEAVRAATAAALSEKNAAESKTAAQEAAERATQAGIAASNAAEEAERSAGIATDAAGGSALNAENAHKSALAAQQSAKNAAESQSVAAASADAASKSQQSAAIDAKTAFDAKVAAAGSAEAAAGSANAAENSASAAAGSERAAETSELKAAKSEKAAKASEQAASESAQAALESKTAAATSEVNAAASAKKAQDVADSLPEDYTTAVNDIATLKQQVANITPDDSSIEDKPWSSKHIIDMLCPPLEESGNPVVCYPVAGYPLGIKAKWEPAQEGSGTPSPENIRPISGRDAVKVERCGENLLPFGERIENIYKQQLTTSDDLLLLSKACAGQKLTLTFSVETKNIVFYDDVEDEWRKRMGFECHGTLADGTEVYPLQCWFYDANDELTKNGKKTKTLTVTMPKLASGSITFYAQNIKSGSFVAYDFGIYAGTTAPTTYTPYIGQTNTLTLPETVYGGEVDAVSGEGQETWQAISFDGTENWLVFDAGGTGQFFYTTKYSFDKTPIAKICSHFSNVSFTGIAIIRIYTNMFTDTSAFSSYLAAQNAAGTPVQIAYKLAEPVPFTATGAQALPALAGLNTVLTDADSTTVTGRADPIKRIEDLEAAVASIN